MNLSVAVDMSPEMISWKNVKILVDSLLENFFGNYEISSTPTSIIAYGPSIIDTSEYFVDYENVCEFVHFAQAHAYQLGNYSYPIKE
uniref:Uncharacterized protein n=1 Tax=Panagrolaimus sp. JU765 TaxID=591449 RepID=A0AC34QP95_9BILA